MRPPLYLALPKEGNYGWGVCSRQLRTELSALGFDIRVVDSNATDLVDGIVLHALTDLTMEPLSRVRGSVNLAYTFFENELSEDSIKKLHRYDFVWAGSTWCVDKLRARGLNHVDVLLQGIDPSIFWPAPPKTDTRSFVIFSGGKFELRKGQDLVIAAFRQLQHRYPDITLVNCWYNIWPETIRLFRFSKHMQLGYGNSWPEFMQSVYKANDIIASRVETIEFTDHAQLREIYARTDIGVFPNRCEGGTNLVLMEYMACARPAVASYSSGHCDILTDTNALPIKELAPFPIYDANEKLWADWHEPSLSRLIEQIEYAYHHRDHLASISRQAGHDMQKWTWRHTAMRVAEQINKYFNYT